MINQRTYEILASSLISAGENVVNSILRNLLRVNKLLTKNPYDVSKAKKIYDQNLNSVMKQYKKNYKTWTEKELAKAYLEGLRRAEKELKAYGLNARIIDNASNVSTVLLNRSNAIIPSIPEIPGQTILMFEGLERHIEYFGVFRSAAYYSLEGTELQILRKANDLFRDVAVMAGEQHFKESDIFTRRRLSQTMLNNFAKRGVNCITYKDGRNFSIDSYCEMVGRTMSGRCALQSSINRYYESGYKLVMVSSHFRACPLCTPYEGEILSVDGKHQFYQSLADAELQGLFHPNCAHNVTSYHEGLTEKNLPSVDPFEQKLIDEYGYKDAQKITYLAQQQQRYIERQIRKYKRVDAVAISKGDSEKARSKIRYWQSRQRDHLQEHQYLPRKYIREQIKVAH